jgi:predicted nucleic acid-binding protein
MNVVDSSGWLAYFADEPQAERFHEPLSASSSLVVPTVSLYEVFKVVLRESTENAALQAVAAMEKGRVVDLSPTIALSAANLSLIHKLPMADSIILATARKFKATLWTLDADFAGIEGVNYFPK